MPFVNSLASPLLSRGAGRRDRGSPWRRIDSRHLGLRHHLRRRLIRLHSRPTCLRRLRYRRSHRRYHLRHSSRLPRLQITAMAALGPARSVATAVGAWATSTGMQGVPGTALTAVV